MMMVKKILAFHHDGDKGMHIRIFSKLFQIFSLFPSSKRKAAMKEVEGRKNLRDFEILCMAKILFAVGSKY